jgi:cyclic pyranopterin phosphate synthase
MFDLFGREITSLRISVTADCNLRCGYCAPVGGEPARPRRAALSNEQIGGAAAAAVSLGVRKIRLTGGEPLVRRDIVDLVALLSRIDGLSHLAMTTNGTLLARHVRQLKEAGLRSVNVSLDTLEPDRYREITRGGRIDDALDGITAALSQGLPVKINMVVLPATTQEDIERMREFCGALGARVQLINLFDLSREKCDTAGFDRPPLCAQCNRIRLTADGRLKPCLHSNTEVALDFARLEECMREAILAKPRHGGVCTNRSMVEIGG